MVLFSLLLKREPAPKRLSMSDGGFFVSGASWVDTQNDVITQNDRKRLGDGKNRMTVKDRATGEKCWCGGV